MSGPSRQLLLDLAQRPALGAEDFLVSASNQAAADMIDRWPDWPHASIVVVAPARAGKTHLANVWRLKSGAARLVASAAARGRCRQRRGCAAGRGPARRHRQRACAVPPAQPGARAQALDAADLARAAGGTRGAPARPALAAARPAPGHHRASGRRCCSRRFSSSISATGSSSWSRTSSVISRCIWSSPWRRRPISWPRSTGWRWPRTAR